MSERVSDLASKRVSAAERASKAGSAKQANNGTNGGANRPVLRYQLSAGLNHVALVRIVVS